MFTFTIRQPVREGSADAALKQRVAEWESYFTMYATEVIGGGFLSPSATALRDEMVGYGIPRMFDEITCIERKLISRMAGGTPN